jgi:DNA (cytosine-5)-methyltransferase 1
MKHASLFSGIGGFDLAAEWAGWENVFHCEWNTFGQQVLKYHFPNSISYNDITKTDFKVHANEIDILTGGFPCQPYSQAGKRLGKADERHLFPEMLRCIKEVKPRWIIGENVRGLISWNEGLVFNEVHDDLEREGYEVQSFLIPAAGVNAPHQRYRVWFVAYSNNKERCRKVNDNREWESIEQKSYNRHSLWNNIRSIIKGRDVTNTECIRLQHCSKTRQISGEETNANGEGSKSTLSIKTDGNGYKSKWENFPTVSPICGGDDGISEGLDKITFSKWRKESIKAYGNAIVPQVAYQIFQVINEFEMQNI